MEKADILQFFPNIKQTILNTTLLKQTERWNK